MSDGECSTTMAGDQALMEALKVIDKNEAHIKYLETSVTSLTGQITKLTNDKEILYKQMAELKADNERLREATGGGGDLQVKELLRVNHQWDLEYKEQEEAFRRYRIDSQQAQHENQTYIAKLKEEKDYQSHEIASLQRDLRRAGGSGDSQIEVTSLKREVSQYEKIIGTLKQRNHDLEEQMYTGAGRHGDGRKVKQLEEEILLLKQQVTAYCEDFEAERRDRERLVEEKQSLALRHEAEITSLKLQLDRCRNELTHYSTEATRLAQQLRLKNQFEEEQYKRHLESRGFVSRGSNSTLPPLDPYVEHDPPSHSAPSILEPPQPAPRRNSPPTRRDNHGNYLLARSSVSEDPHSAPASMGNEQPSPPIVERKRSASPQNFKTNNPASRSNGGMNGHTQSGYSNGYVELTPRVANGHQNVYPDATYPAFPRGQSIHSNGYIMQNGGVVEAQAPRRVEIDTGSKKIATPPQMNGINGHSVINSANSSPKRVTSDGTTSTSTRANVVISRSEEALKIPPMQTKGRHKCPRCARRFQSNGECEDHKARCIS